jgi:hypothetical protein
MSRWENAPSLREVIKLMRVMVALYSRSYDRPPTAVTLDIDDTLGRSSTATGREVAVS